MRRVAISFAEKIEARYERGPREQCWVWDGGVQQGRPSINLRHVTRYIFEQEFGPIPEGYTLWRTDHGEGCTPGLRCRHWLCVNPYHLQLRPVALGQYEREMSWDIDDPTRVQGYKRRAKGKKNGNTGNPEDRADARTDGAGAGVRVGEPNLDQSDGA